MEAHSTLEFVFLLLTSGVAAPKVCFLQTLNAEPIQIVVTNSLIFTPKAWHPLFRLTTPCPYNENKWVWIIYSNLFSVYFAHCYCIDATLSVYSPFLFFLLLLIVEVHSVVRLMPVCWEVGLNSHVPRAVLTHNGVNSFTDHVKKETTTKKTRQSKKCTKRALWVTDLPHYSSSSSWHNYPKSLVTALVSLGLCEINNNKNNNMNFSHQLTRHMLNHWHLSERRVSPRKNLLNIRNVCLQSTCTVKKHSLFSLYTVFAQLSLYTPELNFPSRFF